MFDPGMESIQEDQLGCAGAGYTPEGASVSVRRLEEESSWNYLFADCWEVSYPQCGGRQQSPIDIDITGYFVSDVSEAYNLKRNSTYHEVEDCHIRNTGHGLQGESAAGATFGFLEMDGKKYNALQYHIHCPAEHTLHGAFYPCEVHAVHQAEGATGLEELLVFGVIYKIGSTTDIFIDNFVRAVEANLAKDDTITVPEKVSLRDYHQLRHGFYRYDGSLTTPPCAETVKWFVLILQADMTQEHADVLLEAMQHSHLNNRPVQPQYGRGIWKNSLPGCYFPASAEGRRLATASWDYLMPQCWAALGPTWAPDYPDCAGRKQSPLDIRTDFIAKTGTDVILLDHGRLLATPEVTSHGLQVDYNKGYVTFASNRYNTLQFHLHMPSEHAVDGKLQWAELHAVHQLDGATGLESLLVCGVMYLEKRVLS
eukprot:TRINITY_DN119_c0_g1_i3.p2 TRINITY_DN119_c0_g1~~TRINITY_DN119_c0_g1_i3.p2  ORF type:complete len:426 (+),score=51.19 TRINITY_DN119_c0_g1_i3:1642-2919(+)